MKRTLLLISAVLLSAIAGVQTVMAQKVTLYSAGSKAYECDIAQLDSIVFSDASTVEPEEIVVTVDANGNADGEHWFEKIDDTNFYIDDIKYTAQSGDLVVTGYNQDFFKGAANIISQLKYRGRTMNVVGIERKAFSSCTSMTSLTIPNSVTSIGYSAFSGCSSLTSITIPESVTSIDGYAFSGCSSLTSITIPSNVTSIGNGAFSDCEKLTSIKVEIGNTVYDSRNNCNAIIESATNTLIAGCKNTTIPESVTSIGDYAFYGCSSLTSITIPESVTSIGNYAFSDCSSLTSITIPNSVTSIGSSAFQRCTSLTSITIPESVTRIGYYSFYGCSSLTNVYCYAKNVPSTDEWAFWNSSYKSATLHVLAGSVDAYKAAEPWKNFRSIVAIVGEIIVNVDANGNADSEHQFKKINNSNFVIDGIKYTVKDGNLEVSDYDSSTFTGVASIISKLKYNGQTFDVVSIGKSAFNGCRTLTSVTIGSGVTSIGERAFYDCTSLTSITIPNSVTSIGVETFSRCSSLTSVTIGSGVTSIGDSAFSGCSSLTSITIPESVTSIDGYAFLRCSSLTSITIPESVTSIGAGAFYGCSSLTSFTIPNSVTYIGTSAFAYCSGLTSVTIPNSVTSIGYAAFSGCSRLTDVYCYAENVPSTGSEVFKNSSISSAILHVPAGSVDAYKAKAPWNQFGSIVAIE